MSDTETTPLPPADALAALIEADPVMADKLLAPAGYSVEEWRRAQHAPAAVDHSRPAAALPAVEAPAEPGA